MRGTTTAGANETERGKSREQQFELLPALFLQLELAERTTDAHAARESGSVRAFKTEPGETHDASSILRCWIFNMLVSIVSFMTKRTVWTGLVWPRR